MDYEFHTFYNLNTTWYTKEGYNLFFHYQPEANTENESIYLSFYLIDMLTNNLINKQDRYQGEFKIQKLAEDAYEDIYLVTAQITHSTNKSIHQKTGRGQIFKINQGLELIYTEEEQTEKVGTLHYQYKIEALEPTGKLLTVINCNTRTIERCFLVAEDFKIDQAEQMDMESKKRQSLFKLK